MLQLKKAGLKALDNLRSAGLFPSSWQSMEELEAKTDYFLSLFLDERFRVSRELSGVSFLTELLDRVMRTSESEHMDDRKLSEREKLELVRALDRQNQMLRLYPRYVEMLLSIIEETDQGKQQEVRILELASGSGGLSLALAEEARRKNLPLSIVASDIVPIFIEEGNRQAEEKKLPVTFQLINAFEMPEFSSGSFDLMVLSQSIHHFTPGQLAIMIAQSAKQTKTAFVGIDGYRSMLLAGGVPLMATMQGIASFTLDGFISARKFYSELELDIIAEIATGKRNHAITSPWPLSILTVRFDGIKPDVCQPS